MPSLNRVTPVILTYNEELNIGRTLGHLGWADRVVVVDSGSDDRTVEIVRSFPNTDLLYHPFDTHREQWNYATGQVKAEWVLTLDADYRVPSALIEEIAGIPDSTATNGFFVPFHFRVLGRILKRTLYPAKQVLFRPRHARFDQDVDTERVVVRGPSGRLSTAIIHDDRKSLGRWLQNQGRYAEYGAQKLKTAAWTELSIFDRLRRTCVLGPPAVLLYCLFGKGLVLEGWAGWYYTAERVTAELVLALALMRARAGAA